MSTDSRAWSWCNLGPLADGSSSVAESHVQGSGVITLKGTINLAGIHRPAPGAVVKLAYSNGQNWIARLPCRLLVLSSFANPLGGKTTAVIVGCDLTYFEARKQPPDSLTPRQANPDTPEAVWRAAAPAIPASWLVEQILSALGLTAAGSIPLTNYYYRQEFDLTAGYVDELGKLASSEGYAVRMTPAGLVEFINKAPSEIGAGPLLTEDDLIDLNPINTGDLPGDAVYAKYTSLKLTPPATDEASLNKRNWEKEVSVSAPQRYTHQWTEYNKAPVYDEHGGLVFRQRRDANGKPVFWIAGQSIENGLMTTVFGNAVMDQVFEVKAYQLTEDVSYVTHTVIETEYDYWDRVSIRKTSTLGLWGLEHSETAYQYKFPVSGTTKPDNYSEVLEETNREWSPLGPLKISVGYQQSYILLRGGGDGQQYQSSYRKTTYEKDQISGITKTSTQAYVPYINTPDGSESISRIRDAGNQLDDSRLANILAIALRLVSTGSETQIRTEREFGLQRRPSEAERTAAANLKAPSVETTSTATWVVGSAASQTSVEISPPYVPDDRIVYSGGTYSVIRGQADQAALHYATTENRLLLGHRNGNGIQVLPEVLPPTPLGAIYIRLNDCTAAFRVNGTTWNISPEGVTATADALFWGAVDGAVAEAWFPLPPGASSLPAPVGITTNADPRPANAIAIPSGFSFTSPDLAGLFASLPTDQAPVFSRTITPGAILRPYHQTVHLAAGSGSGVTLTARPWIRQPPMAIIAGSGSGTVAAKGILRRMIAGSGSGVVVSPPSPAVPLLAGSGSGAIASLSQISTPDALLSFSGGTAMAWGSNLAYGWTFTMSEDKVIKGVGFYDESQNGLNGSYGFLLLYESTDPWTWPSPIVPFDASETVYAVFIPSGTTAPLSGPWRRVNLASTGRMLYSGETYTIYCEIDTIGNADNLIKNATITSALPGVTYGENVAWDSGYSPATTAADGVAYFGPMVFFE
jgi:hypothetical protein